MSASLTNGDAHDDLNDSETKPINRSNSKSVTGGGRDTSRKGRGGDTDKKNDAGKDNLSLVIKLESDVKRLKCDLQLSRNRENELRDQIVSYMSSKLNLEIIFYISTILQSRVGEHSSVPFIASLLYF